MRFMTKLSLVCFKELDESLAILRMYEINFFIGRIGILRDRNGASDDDIQRMTVREKSKAIVEDTAARDERKSNAKNVEDEILNFPESGAGSVINLIVKIVFAKAKDGNG